MYCDPMLALICRHAVWGGAHIWSDLRLYLGDIGRIPATRPISGDVGPLLCETQAFTGRSLPRQVWVEGWAHGHFGQCARTQTKPCEKLTPVSATSVGLFADRAKSASPRRIGNSAYASVRIAHFCSMVRMMQCSVACSVVSRAAVATARIACGAHRAAQDWTRPGSGPSTTGRGPPLTPLAVKGGGPQPHACARSRVTPTVNDDPQVARGFRAC